MRGIGRIRVLYPPPPPSAGTADADAAVLLPLPFAPPVETLEALIVAAGTVVEAAMVGGEGGDSPGCGDEDGEAEAAAAAAAAASSLASSSASSVSELLRSRWFLRIAS